MTLLGRVTMAHWVAGMHHLIEGVITGAPIGIQEVASVTVAIEVSFSIDTDMVAATTIDNTLIDINATFLILQ